MYTKLNSEIGVIDIQPLELHEWYSHIKEREYQENVDLTLSSQNYVWGEQKSIDKILNHIRADFKERWSRNLPSTSRPLRVGTVSLSDATNSTILETLTQEIEHSFGIQTLQIHIHYDEYGWSNTGMYEPVPHAHFLFLWYDYEQSKTIKLTLSQLVSLRDLVLNAIPDDLALSTNEKQELSPHIWMRRLENKIDKLLAYERERNKRVRKRYLNVSDISFICGVAEGTVYNWSSSGKLTGFKVNGKLRFLERDVEQFLRNFEGGNYVLSKALQTLYDLCNGTDQDPISAY